MSEESKPDVTAVWMSAMPQQFQMIEHMNSLMTGWMKRRQEALTSGLQAAQQIVACQDPATAARIYADWMGGSLSRIMADVNDAREHADKMAKLARGAVQTVSGQAAATMAAVGEQARTATTTPSQVPETPLRQVA